ncbi:putative galactinol--sucrose galactosyltransferase 6 [Podospora australis]|uniref:Galactinol--sucrose galactosyltransferase 6 n=1 Tax=Podospora australis TaxID=1536484 RepID=A0AAN6X8I5_9PEZI|nr:putative galactinol--sucrose galactosyltransferase 6 [Podospora australis]
MTEFITTYPPLGQVTQFTDSSTIIFHALLDIPTGLQYEPWELALWHSDGGGHWSGTAFHPADSNENARPSVFHKQEPGTERVYFVTSFVVQPGSPIQFTLKFRRGPDHDWRWVRDSQGFDDGLIIVNQKPVQGSDIDGLPDLISNLNPDLRWKSHLSQCPRTRLWSIDAKVDGATEEKSAFANTPLGIPWGGFIRWFSLVRPWSPWLAPRHGSTGFHLDEDAVLCSFLSPKGKHLVFLGMSGLGDVTSLLRSGDSGQLTIHVRNDAKSSTTGTILVAVGDDFESANAAVMYHARDMVMRSKVLSGEDQTETTALGDVSTQWYEDWYDGLGYCTWNALGQKLTEEKVLNAVDTLAKNKINISSLIIDDNWQDIDYQGESQFQYGFNDFEAEPTAFPRGLKALVSDIRSKHKSIQHIAVWHALLGYWGGISPSGPLSQRYKTVEVVREDSERRGLPLGGKITMIAAEDVKKFYDDFYGFLDDCGINGVKTDAQFMIDTLVSPVARCDLTHAYLDAWTIASLRHFSSKVISCMSQTPQTLFYSQLPRNKPPVVVRNSDDFFPEVRTSHPWHIWSNAHNALFTQHLNILPDWDMFQTVHEYSGFHAAARCVSGGPIYITDVPGQHDINLIRRMTGVTPRGKTVVFRPSVLGKTIDQYAGYDDLALLKIGAYHGRAGTGTGILGVFNVSSQKVSEIVPLARFPGVVSSVRYIVRGFTSGGGDPASNFPMAIGEPASLITMTLGPGEYEIYSASPVTTLESKGKEVSIANLGLLGKMTGSAALLNTRYQVRENGRILVDTTLKALGVLGIWISTLDRLDLMNDFMVTIQGQPLPPHTVKTNGKNSRILEVDIETAWTEMELESGWANEVEVKVDFALGSK